MGNRPWGNGGGNNIGSGNVGSGNNFGHNGDNLGVVNRPNYGGNNYGGNSFGGNSYGGNTVINNSSNNYSNSSNVVNGGWGGGNWGGGNGGWGGGGWGGGGWGGGGWGGGGWGNGGWGGGGYGYGGGYASPYYGNWYRGSWGNSNSFWTGVGLGALTSFGVGSIYGSSGYGAYGYPVTGYGSVYNYFPSWNVGSYNTWGLGTYASSSLYSSYVNPYNSIVIASQPVQAATSVVYDYSQPINLAAAAPDPAVETSTEQVFSAARDSFMAGDYPRALELSDQVLKQTPNAPVVHEFRALCLFALKRYDEAAAVAYAVLSTGPGWNWSTLVGLYPDVDTYTNQLRALEAAVRSNVASSSLQFLLAYQYLVQGHDDSAANQFAKVAKLQPEDTLSASFVKALKASSEPAPTTVAAANQPSPATVQNEAPAQIAASNTPPPSQAPPDANTPQQQPAALAQGQPAQGQPAQGQAQAEAAPPPPPADLLGSWKAQPAPDVSIALTLGQDGAFQWVVDTKGKKQTLEGQAGFQDGTLALLQNQGPPLAGKVTREGADKFVFAPPGTSDKAAGLTFTR